MFRKRRQPTPEFRMPPPYQPLTGEQENLIREGFFPFCAMMQVAAADTIIDYVLCRGFDIRVNRFVDYEAGNANKPGIAVAKPFGKRMAGAYEVAQIFPAMLPLQTRNPSPVTVPWRVGQNPGVAETTQGHPADLNETVDEMVRADTGEYVNYMLLDSGGTGGTETIHFEIVTASPNATPPSAVVTILSNHCGVTAVTGEDGSEQVTVYDRMGCWLDEAAADLVGRDGMAHYMYQRSTSACEWQVFALCCAECVGSAGSASPSNSPSSSPSSSVSSSPSSSPSSSASSSPSSSASSSPSSSASAT